MSDTTAFRLNGEAVSVPTSGSLLDALRDVLGDVSVKDGCAPQGQCGACTVLINGEPRVSCVTAIARVANADVTTVDGLPVAQRDAFVQAFEATGASQCGFCTPGILCRLVGTQARRGLTTSSVERALAAHVCRCTGWQTIVEAAQLVADGAPVTPRDPELAAQRATLENGTTQLAGPEVVLGRAPYADDTAPLDAVVAWTDGLGDYVFAETKAAARTNAGAVQGRNSTVPLRAPLEIPEGAWVVAFATKFVEPAYVEPDTSWAEPAGVAASPAANAGAFGAKRQSAVRADAERLANELGKPVKVVWSREAVVRRGKKRPPVAVGLRADGSGILRVARTPGSDDLTELLAMVSAVVPEVSVEIVDVVGPPVGATHRGAVLAELLAARACVGLSAGDPVTVTSPSGAVATATYDGQRITVSVDAGDPLCEITLRSYVIGAAQQAFSMVTSEGIAIDEQGAPADLTMRSFGVVGASGTPEMDVVISPSGAPAVVGGGAVFAAVLGAVWLHEGGATWPTRRAE